MSEPFYVRQTTLADLAQHQTSSDWFDACVAEVQREGGTWFRASWTEAQDAVRGVLLVEGWRARPVEEGAPRFIFIEGSAA